MFEVANSDDNELNLIDCGIESLTRAPLRANLHVLNLHSNNIRSIENLSSLITLKHLDLSSNQITKIDGLSSLVNLKTLNLACNLISVVENLENLRSLSKLNLSFNQIEDLSGFYATRGSAYKLTHLDLHGNKIFSIQHVNQCLSGCSNLHSLHLQHGGADNPVCSQKDYRRLLLADLRQVQFLDGLDRTGQPLSSDDAVTEIPGLDDYLEYLISNESSSEVNPLTLPTPNLDKALDAFRCRGVSTPDLSTTTVPSSELESSVQSTGKTQNKISGKIPANHEKRLELLENQLAKLLSGKDTSSSTNEAVRSTTKHVAKRDVDFTDESDIEYPYYKEESRNRKTSQQSKPNQTSVKSNLRSPASRTGKAGTPKKKSVQHPSGAQKPKPRLDASVSSGQSRECSKSNISDMSDLRPAAGVSKVNDVQLREDIQATYVQLMQELEHERERRWKAEQASRKLVDHIKQLQSQAKNDEGIQDIAVQATTRLKQVLTNEREVKMRLQDEVENLKTQLEETKEQLRSTKETEEEQRRAIVALEQTSAKLEAQRAKENAKQTSETHKAQMRAAAVTREVELLQNSVKQSKLKIEQLQELLISREHEHKRELDQRYRLESKELRGVLDKEIEKAQSNHTREMKNQQEKVNEVMRQYSDLEDEFRMALQIEAQRFQEVQSAFEKTSEELASSKQLLMTSQRKEKDSSDMVVELTALVKEQKGRITELSKSKNEQMRDFKERIVVLEAHVEEARKRMLQLELLKQEKAKLVSEVEAQASVIEGLKSERKLWGQELAQQGASLAQDRGRMESKIETLSMEVASLKKQLEREADAVKIKTRILEDQTDTIKKLKEGLLERDAEIKAAREEALSSQKSMEHQISAEISANQEMQEKVDHLTERKEELKHQVAALTEQLQDSKKAYSSLNTRWKQKSDVIGQLEEQVQQMKRTWDAKETKLTEERDKSIHAASIAVEKLRSMDDTFRSQLASQQQSHQRHLEALEADKQAELQAAHKQVQAVEEEMRSLLLENQASKKAMEERVRRLTSAFTDLQQGLS